VTEVLQAVIACINFGEPLQTAAYYTDHAIYARGPLATDSVLEQTPATPSTTEGGSIVSIEHIHSIELLPGAYVAVVATIGGIEDPDPIPGVTFVFVFAMTSEGWRIDDQFDRIAPQGASAPIYIAEALSD
jgi:hypothetical protein